MMFFFLPQSHLWLSKFFKIIPDGVRLILRAAGVNFICMTFSLDALKPRRMLYTAEPTEALCYQRRLLALAKPRDIKLQHRRFFPLPAAIAVPIPAQRLTS